METIHNFCDNCNNIMYIYLDKDTEIPKLYLYCKACQNKTDYKGNLLYNNNSNIELSDSINHNKYLNYDITLPHIKSENIKCPNSECKSIVEDLESDIIYIKYDKINMKYIYTCDYCGQKWTNN